MSDARTAHAQPVRFERHGPVAVITLNRPADRTAQNSAMTSTLDRAFYRAADDDEAKAVVPAGAGRHFSAGHDIGTPERDAHLPFEQRAGLWWDHSGKQGVESRYARASEVYLGMCRRWRELPKPVIASAQGACVTGGLMLAYEVGMVDQVVPLAELHASTMELTGRSTEMPRMGLALTKRAVNQAEDLQGPHAGLDSVFGLHHLSHAHNAETADDSLDGLDVRAMKAAGA